MVIILGHGLLLLILSQFTLWLLPAEPAIGSVMVLQYAVITVLCACLLTPPFTPSSNRLWQPLLWALAAALCFILGAAVINRGSPLQWVAGSAGVGLLVALLTLFGNALARSEHERPASRALCLAAFSVLCAVPLWLGPLAEAFNPHQFIVDGIVSLSPISHLAVLLQVDYLRSDWFYQHSALGSLRFHYPALWLLAFLYTALLCCAVYLSPKTSGTPQT